MRRATTSRRARQRSKGQAAVEFAFVFMFVFLMFMALLELIFLMHAYNTLADSAKEGVRYAIVHGTGNSGCSGPGTTSVACAGAPYPLVQGAVTKFTSLSLHNVTASNVTVTYPEACNTPGCLVRVTVNYNYQPLFGMGWPSVTIYAAADGRIMN